MKWYVVHLTVMHFYHMPSPCKHLSLQPLGSCGRQQTVHGKKKTGTFNCSEERLGCQDRTLSSCLYLFGTGQSLLKQNCLTQGGPSVSCNHEQSIEIQTMENVLQCFLFWGWPKCPFSVFCKIKDIFFIFTNNFIDVDSLSTSAISRVI